MNNVPNALFAAGLEVTDIALNLFVWMLITGAVLSWLVAFGVINKHNRFVQMVSDFIYRVTEPFLRPIRRIVPPLGGMDLSPIILILVIIFLQSFLHHLAY